MRHILDDRDVMGRGFEEERGVSVCVSVCVCVCVCVCVHVYVCKYL